MRKPQAGQKVWAETLKGTFVIVAVHQSHSLADLRSMNGVIEEDVPFGLIHAVGGDFSPTSMD